MSEPTPSAKADRFNLSAWVLAHRPLALFFLAIVALGGIGAYFQLGQREDPDFTFRLMVVRSFWPGATAEQIDLQITDRLEKKLQEVPHFKRTVSYSKPGESLILLELLDSAPPKTVADSWYQARKKLDDIRQTLPPEARGPFVNDEFGDVFGSIYAFTGDGFSHSELRRYVEDVRRELLRLPDVAKIELVGVQDDRVYIELSHHRLAALGIDPGLIGAAIRAQNDIVPSGRVETGSHTVSLWTTGQVADEAALADLIIRADGRSLRLGDIAEIKRGYVEPAQPKMRFGGQEAIGLAVSMLPRGDVLKLGENLQRRLAELKADLPIGIEFAQVSNQPAIVKAAVGEFMRSLLEAVAIVLVVSFLSLGLRSGLVVAITIPLVLAGTFLAMLYFGIDIHRISTGALIVAMGLLVDDAMIAVEMMARKMEEGWDKFRAATFAYRSTAFPMLTGTLVTAAGFLPIATAKSATGEYTFALFSVVTLALLISWLAAVVVTPLVGSYILPTRPHAQISDAEAERRLYDTPFYRRLSRLIELCMERRYRVILITVAAFVLGGIGMGLTKKQFFPSSNRTEIMVDLWLAEGSSLEATEAEAKRLEAVLAKDPDVATFVLYVGNGSPRFFLSLDQQLFRNNFAQAIVLTRDIAGREKVVERLRALLADDFPGVRGRVTRVPLGPPVNYPVQFRVMGDDPAKLKTIAAEVAEVMRRSPHTLDVNVDWGDRAPALRVEVDQARARALGVSTSSVSQTLTMVTQGVALAQFREDDRLIDIVLRAPEGERRLLSAVTEINVPTASGRSVPLAQVARVQEFLEEPILWRRSRLPTLTARADIVDHVQAPDVAAALDPQMAPIRAKLPPGYRIEIGGAYEENVNAQASINAGMPMMVAVVLCLLMIQLQNVSRMVMVVLTAPLGIIGVALALLVSGRPFGFVAMLGTIALSGMIMRNTVILVDQIRQDLDDGATPWDAVRDSTVRRFRPIVLTAAAAMLAMIPLSTSTLWGPMAFAIMGGLLVATALTILVVPALYVAWYRVHR
ncbi:MAG: efflux RND transporter permease subunit [Rhodospirillales bacterium]|nr:efflux RND transporter permease subunit [Rhodospirillales bacterium]